MPWCERLTEEVLGVWMPLAAQKGEPARASKVGQENILQNDVTSTRRHSQQKGIAAGRGTRSRVDRGSEVVTSPSTPRAQLHRASHGSSEVFPGVGPCRQVAKLP